MLKAILVGTLALLPLVIVGTVLINVLNASRPVVIGFVILLGILAGIAGPIADIKVNGRGASRRPPRPPRAPA